MYFTVVRLSKIVDQIQISIQELPTTKTADGSLTFYFTKKIGLEILCEYSRPFTGDVKVLFYLKKKNVLRMSSDSTVNVMS